MSCLERRLCVGDSERISCQVWVSDAFHTQDGLLPSFLLCPQPLSKNEPQRIVMTRCLGMLALWQTEITPLLVH